MPYWIWNTIIVIIIIYYIFINQFIVDVYHQSGTYYAAVITVSSVINGFLCTRMGSFKSQSMSLLVLGVTNIILMILFKDLGETTSFKAILPNIIHQSGILLFFYGWCLRKKRKEDILEEYVD